jgi:large subunit ribosomal protein L21
VAFDNVYLIAGEDDILVGQPTVPDAQVVATIVEEFRGPKIRIFKFKPKERYRRHLGHRQTYMRLRVDKIVTGTGEEFALETLEEEGPVSVLAEEPAEEEMAARDAPVESAAQEEDVGEVTEDRSVSDKPEVVEAEALVDEPEEEGVEDNGTEED